MGQRTCIHFIAHNDAKFNNKPSINSAEFDPVTDFFILLLLQYYSGIYDLFAIWLGAFISTRFFLLLLLLFIVSYGRSL